MSSTLRTSPIAKGLLQRAIASVLFLPVSLGLNVPLDASDRGLASQDPRALQWEQIKERHARKPAGFMLDVDSVLYDSLQQGDQGSSPADSAKLVLNDGTPVRLKFARAVVSSQVIAGERVPLEVVEPVRAVKDVKAGGGRQPLILAGAAVGMAYWPASSLGFLVYVKGKNATIRAGTEITAYINGDFALDASKFQTAGASPQQKDVPK